jgi:hypothetical protein
VRKKENTGLSIDDEIQKIIAESLTKAKSNTKQTSIVNPLNDIKRKDIQKNSPTKIKLITKRDNKVQVKELEKEIFK